MFSDLTLRIQVAIVRFLLSYNDVQERKQEPQPAPAAFVERIPSPSPRGFVTLHFHDRSRSPPDDTAKTTHTRRPVVIDFHGGGFSSGVPSMDDRWISTLLDTATARPVVVGVDYSLAPENPFPAALQDAAAAIAYLSTDGAARHNLDPSRIVLSGFSAGGSLVLTAPMWMHEQQQQQQRQNQVGQEGIPALRGVLSVYPSVDSRIPRVRPASFLIRFLGETWERAFARRSPVDSHLVSPSAADDSLLEAALPAAVALYPVADDPLCAPCEALRERLRGLGKRVTGHVEPRAHHAWDKSPVRGGDAEEVRRRWAKREAWFVRMAEDVDGMLR